MDSPIALRCKDGDLVVITKDEPGLEANVGCFLWVYGPVRQHPELGPVWDTVPASTEPMAFIDPDGRVSFERLGRSIVHPDAWMAPIPSAAVRQQRPPLPVAVPLTQEWLQQVADSAAPTYLRLPGRDAPGTPRLTGAQVRHRMKSDLCIPIEEDYGYAIWFWFPRRSLSATAHWWVAECGGDLIGEVFGPEDQEAYTVHDQLHEDPGLPWVFADGDWNTWMVLPALYEANLVPRFARETFDPYEGQRVKRRRAGPNGKRYRTIRNEAARLNMRRITEQVAEQAEPGGYLDKLLAALPADGPTPLRGRRRGA